MKYHVDDSLSSERGRKPKSASVESEGDSDQVVAKAVPACSPEIHGARIMLDEHVEP